MELRRLQATDLFSMVKIINGVGIKHIKETIDTDRINDVRKQIADNNVQIQNESEDAENLKNINNELIGQLGMEITMSVVGVILERLPNIEDDLYSFVANVANMNKKNVRTMDATEFIDILITIVQKDEFKDFFNRASRLIR